MSVLQAAAVTYVRQLIERLAAPPVPDNMLFISFFEVCRRMKVQRATNKSPAHNILRISHRLSYAAYKRPLTCEEFIVSFIKKTRKLGIDTCAATNNKQTNISDMPAISFDVISWPCVTSRTVQCRHHQPLRSMSATPDNVCMTIVTSYSKVFSDWSGYTSG